MSRKGFTLIELLLVVGILGILASVTIASINPRKQTAAARNTQRRSDVQAILNAIHQYSIEKSSLPTGTGGTGVAPGTATAMSIPVGSANMRWICKSPFSTPSGVTACNTSTTNGFAGITIRGLTGSFLTAMPSDPLMPAGSGATGYKIYMDVNSRITVMAPLTETGASMISVTR